MAFEDDPRFAQLQKKIEMEICKRLSSGCNGVRLATNLRAKIVKKRNAKNAGSISKLPPRTLSIVTRSDIFVN